MCSIWLPFLNGDGSPLLAGKNPSHPKYSPPYLRPHCLFDNRLWDLIFSSLASFSCLAQHSNKPKLRLKVISPAKGREFYNCFLAKINIWSHFFYLWASFSLHIFWKTIVTGIKGLNKTIKKLRTVSLRPKDTNKPSFQEKNANTDLLSSIQRFCWLN